MLSIHFNSLLFITYNSHSSLHLLQGLIGQYAVPILEEKSVWGTDAPTRIAYMDTQVTLINPYTILLLLPASFATCFLITLPLLLGYSSLDFYSLAKWKNQWQSSYVCWSSCMDNPGGKCVRACVHAFSYFNWMVCWVLIYLPRDLRW